MTSQQGTESCIRRLVTYESRGESSTAVPRFLAIFRTSSSGRTPLETTSTPAPSSMALLWPLGRSPITTMSPGSMDFPMESTLMEMTHNWPEDSWSASPTSSSPSSTSTIAPTETGLSAKVEAPRDSRVYMRARFRSVMIPVIEPSSSTMGSWLMFRLAMVRPTWRRVVLAGDGHIPCHDVLYTQHDVFEQHR